MASCRDAPNHVIKSESERKLDADLQFARYRFQAFHRVHYSEVAESIRRRSKQEVPATEHRRSWAVYIDLSTPLRSERLLR